MNAIQHTPGPWNLPSHVAGGDIGIIADSRLLAMVTNDEDEPIADSEQLANARLMAAAPELLALCKTLRQRLADLLRHVDEDTDSDADLAHDRDAVDDADAAIAKAEGRA